MKFDENKIFTKALFLSLLKIISFILVFVMILEGLSITVFSKKAATQYKNAFSKSYSFTTEPANSIDIALIGSSDLYSGFIPVNLWDKYGYTSTVISTPKQTVSRSYTFLEELLKTQSPKLLVIETDMFYQGVEIEHNPDLNKGRTERLSASDKMKRIVKMISNVPVDGNIENHFTVFMFHDEWKKLSKKSYKAVMKEKDTVTCEHGYNFNKIVYPTKDNKRMTFTEQAEAIPDESILYLNRMLDLCRQSNIKVAFVEMPSLTSWNYARHNAVKQFAEKNSIPFIDLNLEEHFTKTKIKCENDFRDDGNHLNYYGAEKATDFLGEFINNTYSDILPDKRNDSKFVYWQESSNQFKEKYNVK